MGLPGTMPTDNSMERGNREIKGSTFEEGMLTTQKHFSQCILKEFPKLIYYVSTNKCGVNRELKISFSSNMKYKDAKKNYRNRFFNWSYRQWRRRVLHQYT